MDDHGWSELEGPERPIAVVRSEPVRLRFERRYDRDLPDAHGLVTLYRDRRIAMAPVTPDRLRALGGMAGLRAPVRLVGMGGYLDGDDVLALAIYAEVTERYGWHESEEDEVFLGTRFRGRARWRFPGDLERETRDLFLALLQGPPHAAIEELCEAATKESVAMHPIWERCRRQAVEDGLPPTAYKPGSDIAEGLWTRRWKKADLDREDR